MAHATDILSMMDTSWASVRIDHVATSVTRVAHDRVRLTNDGDELTVELEMADGGRQGVNLIVNQLDPASIRDAVQYLRQLARAQRGDPTPNVVRRPPRTYLPNTSWYPATAAALNEAPTQLIPALTQPLFDAGFGASAFVGVRARSTALLHTGGISAAGHDTDTEVTLTGWTVDEKGSGWAGQAARNWATLDPAAVARQAVHLTRLSQNPVAFEPGRRLTILGRPAVAQIMYRLARDIDALAGVTPLFDDAHRPKIGQRVFDARVTLSSDPHDPDGGYLPFDYRGYPLKPAVWIEHGVLRQVPMYAVGAAEFGLSDANDPPQSIRMDGGPSTIDEMIANCAEGIYVNRIAALESVDRRTGMMTGVTNGGCFLVRHGKIEKSIRDLRFLDSPYFFLNRLQAVGPTARSAFGYSPTQDEWPLAPTIVPPIMVQDFNFIAMADAV
jgi:predicted Zn-dependent protease